MMSKPTKVTLGVDETAMSLFVRIQPKKVFLTLGDSRDNQKVIKKFLDTFAKECEGDLLLTVEEAKTLGGMLVSAAMCAETTNDRRKLPMVPVIK